MPLADTAIRRAAPRSRPYKMFDSGGLFLLVNPGGGKWWRLKYRFAGREKLLSLGTYPKVALADAGKRRDAERRKLAEGIDPAINRKAVKEGLLGAQANSFEVVAREWIGQKQPFWSNSNSVKTTRLLEVDVFPWLGKRPIAQITPPELLSVLRRRNRGARLIRRIVFYKPAAKFSGTPSQPGGLIVIPRRICEARCKL